MKKKIEGESEKIATSRQSAESGPDLTSADEAFSKLLQLVRTVQAGMQNIEGSHGLSGSQLWSLWQISAQPGLRVAELAEAQHIHPSTASNLLDKLEARGLVRRERSDTDSRVVRLYLADAGVELAKSIPGPMQGRLRNALREVPAEVLDGLLKGMTAVLDIMSEPPR
jgi:DNA-binding MarR family transcriptional regulator